MLTALVANQAGEIFELEGYGAVGFRVKKPGEVQSAVLEALSGQKPAVVDVQIDPKEPMQERLKSNLGVYGSY